MFLTYRCLICALFYIKYHGQDSHFFFISLKNDNTIYELFHF